MTITASIVTYNTPQEELRLCLESLYHNEVERIYIIDNSPSDTLTAFLDSLPFRNIIDYIPNHTNPGYGAAHNIALKQAIQNNTRYHLVINSDVYFQSECLQQLTQYLDLHPEAGQVQPKIVSIDGSNQYASRLLPTPLTLFGRRFLPSCFMRNINKKYMLVNRPLDTPINIPYHQGSFMLLRVDALKKVGLFDERFFMYPEDIDLTRRIHEQYTTMYLPNISITHAHRASSYHNFKMLKIHIINMIRYFNKWGWFIDPKRRLYNRQTLSQLPK
jgi:GT2 family glycosyltransferase